MLSCGGHLELDWLQKIKGYRCALNDYFLQVSLKFFQRFRRYFDNRHTKTWSKTEFTFALDNNWYVRLTLDKKLVTKWTFLGELCFFFLHTWTPCFHHGAHTQASSLSRFTQTDLPSNVCYCGISPLTITEKLQCHFFIPKLPHAFPLAAETNISGFN